MVLNEGSNMGYFPSSRSSQLDSKPSRLGRAEVPFEDRTIPNSELSESERVIINRRRGRVVLRG